MVQTRNNIYGGFFETGYAKEIFSLFFFVKGYDKEISNEKHWPKCDTDIE